MKNVQKANQPKRKLIIIVVIALLLVLIGTGLFAVKYAGVSGTAQDKAVLMYLRNDLESQEIGEFPDGVWYSGDETLFQVETVPTSENADNKAIGLSYSSGDTSSYIIDFLGYAPIQDNFVLSFSFLTGENQSEKLVEMRYDAVESRHSRYDEYGGGFTLLKISDTISVNDNTVFSGVTANAWYDIDLEFDMAMNTVAVYVNDKLKEKSIDLPEMVNAHSFYFVSPEAENGKWYIDNLKTYIADEKLSDKEYAYWVNEYESSDLTPIMEYELSRAYQYNKFMFASLYHRFVARIDGIRFYKDNQFQMLSTPIFEEEEIVYVPVNDLAKAYGATVNWDESLQKLTVVYDKKELEVILGENSCYIDGEETKLVSEPVLKNGTVCMQLEPTMDFFGVEYTCENELLFFGEEMDCPWDMGPMELNSFSRTIREEIIARMEDYLIFDYPTADEVLAAYEEKYNDTSDLHLFIDDFEEVKAKAASNQEYGDLVKRLLAGAESSYAAELPVYETRDGKRGAFQGAFLDNAYNLSFAYKMTGDEKYKNRLWENLEVLSTFPDYNPAHMLDIGAMAEGLAIAYNWLYDDWSAEQRQVIEEMISTKILTVYEESYSTPIYSGVSSISYNKGNVSVINNSALLCSALALMEQEPELCSELISNLIIGVGVCMQDFAPDGAWEEGIAYWHMTISALPPLISNLQDHLGSDYGFLNYPGFAKTFYYPFALDGSESCFTIGDASEQAPQNFAMMWWAEQSGDMNLAYMYKERMKNQLTSIDDLIYYVDTEEEFEIAELPDDFYYRGYETAMMRTGWGPVDTYVVFHGGDNDGGHGHIDNGSFQFDMIGERWACEVPKEDYNLVQYGSYQAGGASNTYTDGYYRNIGEGHNTVVADLSNNRFGQNKDAISEIVRYGFSDTMSYAIMDLKETNDLYTSALRGVKLNKITGEILVQDEFKASELTEFWWFMHTKADIELSADKKTATLTLSGKSITATIISDGDEVFQILPAERLKGYGENAPLESSNEDYMKLAIQKKDSDTFNVAVAFRPLLETDTELEYVPLEEWDVTAAEKVVLNKVYVDNKPLESFNPLSNYYEIRLEHEKSPIPSVFVYTESDCKVEMVEATTVPGITTVSLLQNDAVVGEYKFVFTPINDSSKFLNEKQIPISDYSVTSEPQSANIAANLFDANLETKYATNELGGTVTVDFGKIVEIYEVQLAFMFGDVRNEFFKISVSEDGVNYTEVYDGKSSGTSTSYESFIVGPVNAQYMKVSFFGSTKGKWVSVTELAAFRQ